MGYRPGSTAMCQRGATKVLFSVRENVQSRYVNLLPLHLGERNYP